MFNAIDIRSLAELSGPERAFVSLYLSGTDTLSRLEQRVRKVRAMLTDNPAEVGYFHENMKLVQAGSMSMPSRPKRSPSSPAGPPTT